MPTQYDESRPKAAKLAKGLSGANYPWALENPQAYARAIDIYRREAEDEENYFASLQAPAPVAPAPVAPAPVAPAPMFAPAPASPDMVFPKGEEVKPYSGLPESYRDQLLGFLMPQVQSGVANMETNIDDYTQNALGTYRQEFDRYIGDEIPRQVRNLANRGILDSSVAENTLSQTYSDALRKSSGMGYQTAMEAAKLKTNIPSSIGQLLNYGQYSEDPTVMYRTLAGLLSNMMP